MALCASERIRRRAELRRKDRGEKRVEQKEGREGFTRVGGFHVVFQSVLRVAVLADGTGHGFALEATLRARF